MIRITITKNLKQQHHKRQQQQQQRTGERRKKINPVYRQDENNGSWRIYCFRVN